MAKRRPGTELNHDNWEDEGEPEEKGSWTTASEAELSKRVIKTARRRNPADKPAGASSAFGGFSGFSSSTPTTTAPSSIFAFLSQDNKKDDVDSAEKKTEEPKTGGAAAAVGDKEYHAKLRALNQSLCDWIKQHVEKNPICILTPIFKDYEKHLQDIESTKTTTTTTNGSATTSSSNTSSAASADKPAATAFKGFSFGTTASSAPAPVATPAAPSTTTATSPFGGSAPSSNSTLSNFSTAPKISFGSSSSTSGSLFGKSPEPLVPSASTGFSFGGAKPFSFGNTGPPAAAAAKEETEEAGDDEDEPPKVEFKAVVEEDSVYSKRCKVFFKVDGNFQERGIGTIFVKPVKDSKKHQMIVRADTSLGNILVNLVLTAGIPVKKMGTNNVMLVCIPNTDFDKPVSVLLKVKTAADADEVVEKLTGYSGE